MTDKQSLIRKLTEGSTSVDILGYAVFWNIRNIDVTQDELTKLLENCDLKASYAKEHNYRSAFIRALRNMEEKRIIRLVEENANSLRYQFTAENKIVGSEGNQLEYDPETVVDVSKVIYRETKDFEKALVRGKDAIRKKIVEFFYREKSRFQSPDITRLIQRIFSEKADMLALREQGSLYFVPAEYTDLITNVAQFVRELGGGSSFDRIPIIDLASNRTMVGNAAVGELLEIFSSMEREIGTFLEGDKEVTKKWFEGKKDKILNMKDRITRYSDVIPKPRDLETKFESLEKQLSQARVLDLD